MYKTNSRTLLGIVAATTLMVTAFTTVASANHSWGGYHWARTANPLSLKLGDNVTAKWDPYLALASNDWSTSTVLDTTVVPGVSSTKNCRGVSGRVEVCNSRYGGTGWLGIASIYASGTHITQGTVKLNDTYFDTAKYNTPAWRSLVMCQEIGHTFGLDHQDENFTNAALGTCMDYSNDPVPNQHPNLHDYAMLTSIYTHLDTTTTASTLAVSSGQDVDHNDRSTWGKSVRTSADGHKSLFERDMGNGKKVFTFVVWADPESETAKK